MTADLDVCRAAKLMIDQHGDGAADYALSRFKELYNNGEGEGAATWKPILKAIAELQRERGPGEPLN